MREEAPATPSSDLTITARDLKFDKKSLVVPGGADVRLTFVNNDSGVLHNVAVYTDRRARQKIWVGELFSGRKTEIYRFKAPAAGSYFFRCDLHPDTMTGTLIAK